MEMNETLETMFVDSGAGAGTIDIHLNGSFTNFGFVDTNLSNHLSGNTSFMNASEHGLDGGEIIYEHHDDLFKFLVNGLGITIVAILGIFGNILSAVVLSRPQMKSSVTCLLLGLTFCDTMLISVSILIYSLPFMCDYSQSSAMKAYRLIYYPLWVPYLFPISITAQTGSVYLTLAVTIERYIAVCHSLRARSICTWRRARYCVIAVMIFSITYNAPRWWEVKTLEGFDLYTNTTIYINDMSELRANNHYITIYINWAYLVVMYLVPFSGLVAFNLAIYRQVRKANRERQVLSKLQRREMGLATMLLCVVVVFLMCNVLPLVNNILECFYDMSVDQLVAMSNFLVVVNSSVNFVIYCTCGERFRRLLLRLCRDFLWCRLGKGSMRNSAYRKSQFYRGQHDARNIAIYVIDLPAQSERQANGMASQAQPPSTATTAPAYKIGGDFEEVSLASVANHTCLTTNGGTGNGTIVVDISGQKPSTVRNAYRDRNRTIPTAHHHHQQNHNSNGKAFANRSASTPLTPS